MTDSAWKIITLVMGSVLVPTFGWVWNTHTQLTNLRADYEHTRMSVQEMKENSTDIKIIQNDLKHMNEKIDDLMVLVVKMSREKKEQ